MAIGGYASRPAPRRTQDEAVSGDGGFTLVEVIVAMLVLAVALLGLMAVQVGSLSTLSLAKQRQTASQLANQVMEQMRALPYGTVTGGMHCGDLSAPAPDPNIALVAVGADGSCTATFRPTYDASISEALATTSNTTPVTPLAPHVQPPAGTTLDGVAYGVRSYVSRAAGSNAGFWLTAVTTWSSPATKGVTKTIAARSRLYSPEGCLALSTHPFSGPCQAFLYGNAGTLGGGLAINSTRAGLGILDGLDVTSAELTLTSVSTRLQAEQVVSAQSGATTSGAQATGGSGSVREGSAGASSAADTDPGTGLANSPPAASPLSQTAIGGLLRSGGGAQLRLEARPGDTGSTLSTVAATGSPACQDAAGSAISNGQACASSTVLPSGPAAATLTIPTGSGSRTLTLADLPTPTGATRAHTGRFTAPGGTHCPSTRGAGCVSAGVQRSLGTARMGVLPALQPGDTLTDGVSDLSAVIGTTPLVTVDAFADRADSQLGVDTVTGPTAGRSGTLRYWDSGAFRNVPIGGAPASYAISPVVATYGGVVVRVSGSVTVGAATRTRTGPEGCAAVCVTDAGSGSVVLALSYEVSGALTGGFSTSVDLGSVVAQTTYKAAPDA